MKPERRAEEEEASREYAAAIRRYQDGERVDWTAYNGTIMARWSWTALLRVKRRAWRIMEEAGEDPHEP